MEAHLADESWDDVKRRPPSHGELLYAAFVLAGVMRLQVTELEQLAADLDSDLISSTIERLRADVDALGTRIVREQEATR